MSKLGALLLLAGCVFCAVSRTHAASAGSPLSSTRAAWGTLRGSVTLGHAPATASSADDLRNAVVYLEHVAPEGETTNLPLLPARMIQEGPHLHPRVLPVVRGTSVEFPSRDLSAHDIVPLPKSAAFDLGRPVRNGAKTLRFDTPGVVKVLCRIHSDLRGLVVVLDNPFYAQPGDGGRFVIDGIPPGAYRVVVWHERARLAAKPVRIEAGKASDLSFELSLTGQNGG